jgi:hypothetical protein
VEADVEGRYRSAAEIAEAEGVTRSFVNRLLRLTLLAPDIQEAILGGGQPERCSYAAAGPGAGDAERMGGLPADDQELGLGVNRQEKSGDVVPC